MNKVIVESQGKDTYKQEIQVGNFKFLSDAPREVGGTEVAPNPHDLLLSALGACTSMTMQIFAKRRGWDLQSVKVELTEEKVDSTEQPGRQISKITRLIKVGGNLSQEQIDGLKMAADKCPVHKLLFDPKEIVTTIVHA